MLFTQAEVILNFLSENHIPKEYDKYSNIILMNKNSLYLFHVVHSCLMKLDDMHDKTM